MRRNIFIAAVIVFFLFVSILFAATPGELWFPSDSIWTYKSPVGEYNIQLGDTKKIEVGPFGSDVKTYRILKENNSFFSLFFVDNKASGPLRAFRISSEYGGIECVLGPGGKGTIEKFKIVLEDTLLKVGFPPTGEYVYPSEWVILSGPITIGTKWQMALTQVDGEDDNGRPFWVKCQIYGQIVKKEKIFNYPESWVVEYSIVTSAADKSSSTKLFQTWWLVPEVGVVKIKDATGFEVSLKSCAAIPKSSQAVNPNTGKITTTWGAIK